MSVRDDVQEPDYRAHAAAGMEALQRWYRRWTGRWRTAGWWNTANALTAVIAYTHRTADQTHLGVVERTFKAARRQHPDFLVSFYDDNGWWGLAWVAAYDLTGEARYLNAARTIFANLLTGWDDACGGGVWWNTDRSYKNAVTNELFLTLAARLQQRCPGTGEYLHWALREWDWFCARGLIGADGLVNDGLSYSCANNGGPTWTYNQGVVLGGLAALHEITGDASYLRQGEAIADAALSSLTTPAADARHGILLEPSEHSTARSDRDRPQFKGIFVRNLYDFSLQSPRPAYSEFIRDNARSIWANDRNSRNQFGLHWAGPFDYADASRQSSALDALNAAVPLAARDNCRLWASGPSRRSRSRHRSSPRRRRALLPILPGRPGRPWTAASRCRRGPAGRRWAPTTRSWGGSARTYRRRRGSGTRIGARAGVYPVSR